jgi:hypothetical protein
MSSDGLTCRICGRAVRYYSTRFAYAHVSPLPDGDTHGPIPSSIAKPKRRTVTGGTIEVDPVSGSLLGTSSELAQ